MAEEEVDGVGFGDGSGRHPCGLRQKVLLAVDVVFVENLTALFTLEKLILLLDLLATPHW